MMMKSNFHRLSSLLLDRRGTSTVEMALAAPIFIVTLLGMADITVGFAERIQLEQAAQRSIELATARATIETDYEYVRTEAAASSGVSASNIVLDQWLECNNVRSSDFEGVCGNGQQVARYVSVRINGTYEPIFGYGIGNGSIPIVGDAAVRIQ